VAADTGVVAAVDARPGKCDRGVGAKCSQLPQRDIAHQESGSGTAGSGPGWEQALDLHEHSADRRDAGLATPRRF